MSISPHIAIELHYDGAWQDITPGGMSRQNIQIRRGRSDEASQTDPASCRLQINNRDGRYSPRNPESPLYGKIGRNTPIRVRLGADNVRFVGEVAAWPARWDVSGNDVWVPIHASGVLRRLENINSPLRSTLYRGTVASDPVAYWPLEDGENSTQMASGLDEGEPMTIVRTPGLAAFDGFPSSESLPQMQDGQFVGAVNDSPDGGDRTISWVMHAPSGGVDASATLIDVHATGSVQRWTVALNPAGSLTLTAYSRTGAVLNQQTGLATNGEQAWLRLRLLQESTSVEYFLIKYVAGEFSDSFNGVIVDGATVGQVGRVKVGSRGLGDTAAGHLAVHSGAPLSQSFTDEVNAFQGEAAARRVERLCSEEGIPLTIEGDPDATAAMGPQAADTLLGLLRECADADLGILGEQREQIGLRYRTHESLYNRAPAVTLQYRGDLAPPLEPTEDDQLTVNDVTVKRRDGSSARAVQQSGPLSVQEVGRYDASHTLNLHSDDQVRQQAAWRLHLGTIDEPRYPVVTVDLEKNAGLASSVSAVDAGDRVAVTGLPPWLPPGDAALTVQGTTETLNRHVWLWEANTSPARAHDVFELDSAELGRLASDGSELDADVDASTTSVPVLVTAGPQWTADSADLPLDVEIGGEVLTVTAVADSGTTSQLRAYGFEDGDLDPFTTSGAADWVVQSTDTNGSSYAAQSGNIADGQRSQLTLVDSAPDGGTVTFAFKVSSEQYYDFLEFYIDGVQRDSWSGSLAWQTSPAYALTAGEHELVWVYSKDGSASSGSDAAWVDDIAIYGPVQDFTVTRSTNGITKSHQAGQAVELHHPGVLALGQSGENF